MNFLKKHWLYIIIGLFILYGVFVRFQGLGYSEFQGDETNPLRFMGDYYGSRASISEFYSFLLEQKRGPGQYIINYINVFLFGFHGEFFIRLPFFIFGVLAFFSMYKLALKMFDKQVALFSVLFLALNGLYIAFARITQYQTFMYFVTPLAVYLYLKAFEEKNYKKTAVSGFLLSLCLLGHYDTLTVGAFFAFFLLAYLIRKPKDFKYILKSSAVFLVFFLVPAILFYIPFFRDSYYTETTSGYLTGRLFGSGFMPRTPWSELGKLLTLYMPIEAWLLFLAAIIGGILSFIFQLGDIKIFKLKLKKELVRFSYFSANIFLFLVVIYSHFSDKPVSFPMKPRLSTLLVYLISFGIIGILLLSKKVKAKHVGLVSWFLLSFSVYFFFIKDPRTHVYITFMPAFILSGYAFANIFKIKYPAIKWGLVFAMLAYYFYLSCFYWVVFVNKNPEYPWWDKTLLTRNLYNVQKVRHKKVDGVFGFNNKRHWQEVRDLYDKGCLMGTYNSNEKNSVTTFYLGFDQTFPDEPDLVLGADTIFVVEGPHSWYYWSVDKVLAESDYNLIYTFKNKDYPVNYILGKADVYKDQSFLKDGCP